MSQEKNTRHKPCFQQPKAKTTLNIQCTHPTHTALRASPSQHPAEALGQHWGGFPSTHVAFPQIFLWYHCLQLVKYFLLVPISFCTAQTLGLQEGQSREGSVRGPTATRGVGGEGAQGLGCAGELTKQRQKGKSSPSALRCFFFTMCKSSPSCHLLPPPKVHRDNGLVEISMANSNLQSEIPIET